MKQKTTIALFALIIFLDLYCFSFFLLVKPCEKIGRADYNFEGLLKNDRLIFLGTSSVCVFEGDKNEIAYYFYWPLHRLLEKKGYWYFIKITRDNN